MIRAALPKDIRQFEINSICSALVFCRIHTTNDLLNNLPYVIEQIRQHPQIFKPSYTQEQCFLILKRAIEDYNKVNTLSIKLEDKHIALFNTALQVDVPYAVRHISTTDDLSRVTQSYDRLAAAKEKGQFIHERILQALSDKEFIVVPQVIVGTGDTGTTLWLEKFKAHHDSTLALLSAHELPSVLMIGEATGSWKHDYTLAQPQSILERTTTKENPSAYLPTSYYQANPYANSRHLYQANQATLGLTEAPILRASILRIEKRSNHAANWSVPEQEFRLVVNNPNGEKNIYTNELNICTGLGPARDIVCGALLKTAEYEQLHQYDPKKGFTPIVDGNQFILTNTEEGGNHRNIVIYGGGGTAAACYRKGFFGYDVHTQDRQFTVENQKNSVLWVAKQFQKAGTGKLATTAIRSAHARQELLQGELIGIEQQKSGKLLLTFRNEGSSTDQQKLILECDQLIYSVGQDDRLTRAMCREIEADLALVFDENDMVLNVSSPDGKVIFFGAAAMAVREKEYMEATWRWLHSENIGGDVGPGSMPPTRAQIKQYNFLHGIQPTSINANMDNKFMIIKYLEKAGVESDRAIQFVDDLIRARKLSTSGASRAVLHDLLREHHLDNKIKLKGLGHLVINEPSPALNEDTTSKTRELKTSLEEAKEGSSDKENTPRAPKS